MPAAYQFAMSPTTFAPQVGIFLAPVPEPSSVSTYTHPMLPRMDTCPQLMGRYLVPTIYQHQTRMDAFSTIGLGQITMGAPIPPRPPQYVWRP